MDKTGTDFIITATRIFKTYKALGEKALLQVPDEALHISPNEDSNSIAVIIYHLSGNMLSRWTDFLTSDGEKTWRHRDAEFENTNMSRIGIISLWEEGWKCLFDTLSSLSNTDLGKIILIREEPHSVMEAISRQLAHYAYHIGQIIYLAKMYKSGNWQSLSIPKGKSEEFNSNMKKSERLIHFN